MFLRLLTALAFLSGAALSAAERPNVLFLLTDDQRPDTIHALGNNVIDTPNLDKLVSRGVSFSRAVCSNPICTPSRAEILSGCNSFQNGVGDFGGKLKPELVLWPRAMHDAGYRTGYVGKWHNNGRPSHHGFETAVGLFSGGGSKWYEEQTDWRGNKVTGYRAWIFQNDAGNEKYPEKGVGLTPDISARFADAAIEFLQQDDDRPFFLQVNFTAPHDPLFFPPGFENHYKLADIPLPPNYLPQHPFDYGNNQGRDEVLLPFPRSEELIRKTIRVYYSVISHLDRQVGRILDTLERTGRGDNTIVIYTSDHGVGIGSHGIRGKQNMYEHTINVPLIVAGPGLPHGVRRSGQVALRDLYPTVCDLCDIEIPSTVTGKSFVPILKGEAAEIRPFAVGYFRDKQRMIRKGDWKLIEYPQVGRIQLFNLKDDPYELHDLADDSAQRERKEHLLSLLRGWQQSVNDPVLKKTEK